MAICFLPLILRLSQLQIIDTFKYQQLAEENSIRLINTSAQRGRIYDRDGRALVKDIFSFDVSVIPQEIKDKDKMFIWLSEISQLPKDDILRNYRRNYKNPFMPVNLISRIDKKLAIKVEENRLRFPGMLVTPDYKRSYIYDDFASHILGYIGPLAEGRLSRLRKYGIKTEEIGGKYGIEKFYDMYLKGISGGMQIEVDNLGRQLRVLGLREASKGKNIFLTIDYELQRFIEELLEQNKGAITILNPNTGEILAMSSFPDFNPNLFINPRTENESLELSRLLTSRDAPFLNRNIRGLYPAGSIFKLIMAIGALDSGLININTRFNCEGYIKLGGRKFRCWLEREHGNLNLVQAIARSCNVFFYKLGLKLGVDNIYNYAKKLGLGDLTNIDLPIESVGIVPNESWKGKFLNENWYKGDTLNISIGQGYLLVTPLQILRAVSAIANGGYLIQPYLVKRIEDVNVSRHTMIPVGIDKKILDIVKRGMLEAVSTSQGTGRRAEVEGVRLCGKTATVQTSRGESHALFVGFTPMERSEYVFIVLLEHAGKGGFKAADFASKIVEFLKYK